MATSQRPTTSYIALFEQLGKTTTLLVAIMLVMSVCYDFAFIHALGLSFNEIPSTTAEHLRSALLWVPYLVLLAAGLTFHELLARRIEGGKTEDEIMASISPKARTFRRWGIKAPMVGFAMVALTLPFSTVGAAGFYLLGLTGWLFLAVSVVKHERILPKFSFNGAMAFIFVPALFAWVAYLGDVAATALISAEQPKWEMTLRWGNNQIKHVFLGIRRFSTFAIAVDPNRSVMVIPNDSIFIARKLEQPLNNQPNMCQWFNVGCHVPRKGAIKP